MAMERWLKAGIVETRFEGDRVSQALNEAGIPYLIKSFHDTAYNGLYIFQKGWGAVLVPEDFLEQAEKLMADTKESFQKEERDELDEYE